MSEEFYGNYSEDVQTFCLHKRGKGQVTLSLLCSEKPKGNLVTGVVENCSSAADCEKGCFCLLGKRISTGRRRK